MHLIRPQVDVEQKNLAIICLGQSAGQSCCEGRGTRRIGKTGYPDQLGFMGQMMQLEIEADTVPDRFAKRPDEMVRIPWRQVLLVRTDSIRLHRSGSVFL